MSEIVIDTWLYGQLSHYGKAADQGTFANLQVHLRGGSTIADLLAHLGLATEERGITFVNGQLSAMPGMQADLGHVLSHDDRVAFFDLRSMWPFQYRHGVAMTSAMSNAMAASEDGGLHTSYRH